MLAVLALTCSTTSHPKSHPFTVSHSGRGIPSHRTPGGSLLELSLGLLAATVNQAKSPSRLCLHDDSVVVQPHKAFPNGLFTVSNSVRVIASPSRLHGSLLELSLGLLAATVNQAKSPSRLCLHDDSVVVQPHKAFPNGLFTVSNSVRVIASPSRLPARLLEIYSGMLAGTVEGQNADSHCACTTTPSPWRPTRASKNVQSTGWLQGSFPLYIHFRVRPWADTV